MIDEKWELEFESFPITVLLFVENYTNFKNYEAMTEEKKAKYREKLTLEICFAFSPRKNFDITKNEVREMVSQAIEYWRKNDAQRNMEIR